MGDSSRASPAAWPRACSWSARVAASRWRTNRTASSSSAGGSSGRASANRSAVRRGLKRSVSSPRARACSLAPSSPKRATSADRGSSATEPIVRRPKRARRARMSASRVSRRAGYGARNRPSSPGGTRIGGPPSGAWAAATLAAKLVPATPARGGPGSSGARASPIRRDQRLLDPPQPGQAVDMDGEPPERRVGDVARAGDPGAERREPLAGGLDGVPVRLRRRGRGRSPRARAGGRSRAGSPGARRGPERAGPRRPPSRPSRAVRRGRSGRAATRRRCRRSPGTPRRDRASRSGRCGQSRCSRRMGIGRCRGAFQVDGGRRGWGGRRMRGPVARMRLGPAGDGPASSPSRTRQASRAPPSAYRISRSVRRPGGP